MDGLQFNPFAVLTFIVAPAILTNASSVMALGTSNRFARSIDRVRTLASLLGGQAQATDPETMLRRRQLEVASRRVLLLVRALTAFYVSVGEFALASFASLLGAISVVVQVQPIHLVPLAIALLAGIAGVGGLLTGSALLVAESRLALVILREETALVNETAARVLAKVTETEESPGLPL